MPVYMLGGAGEAPFNRTFFNVTLGDILHRAGKEQSHRLTLYLTDGTTLDVCEIDELSDAYLVVRTYRNVGGDACSLGINLVPYGMIYRIELSPREAEANERVGFHWAPHVRQTSRIEKGPGRAGAKKS